ncbi:Integrase zinc binding domain [Popillia japonica]|uniref:RNA-directed DNA polymerase n=1 Tax=Popillia japonica TaxID=7064 RepID=A0AAW1MMW1_POPJA
MEALTRHPDWRTKEANEMGEHYKTEDGRLYRMENGVVPKRMRWKILKLYHDDLGHPAMDKTIDQVKQAYWYPGIRRYVRGYIGACKECLYYKCPGENSKKKEEIPAEDTTAPEVVEPLNRFVTPALATITKEPEGRDWDRQIGKSQYGINNTYHKAIKTTPFRLLMNYKPRKYDGNPLEDETHERRDTIDIATK